MHESILLFGGRSDERLVSVASAQNLAISHPFQELWFIHLTGEISRVNKLELTSHQRPFEVPFQPTEKPFAHRLSETLELLRGKVVFLSLHGTEGEDGTIQELFEEHRIAFTGCGSASSRNCFDKKKAKAIVETLGLPTPPGFEFKKSEAPSMMAKLTEFLARHKKIVVKPTESGSSIGLEILSSASELPGCIERIGQSPYGVFIAEGFITGRELTVGVFEENGALHSLPPSEVVLNAGHSFDYQGKYLGRGTTEITPAQVSPEERERAGDLAVRAHEALGCYGYTRTDMILTSGGPVFLETNTLPGMTKASFYPQQLQADGRTLSRFIEDQIKLARERYEVRPRA